MTINKNNVLRGLYSDEIITNVSSLNPLELSMISELLFFIRERESEHFTDTLLSLFSFENALYMWDIMDFMWMTPEDRDWAAPIMTAFIRKQIYKSEEFDL